ncbi:IclR family transcriptional regulator [uncultured Jatrophihabitans sp.]|uniref:IclR family transcriptional regulator n=1 Tax=uncultured Jatrophihabitans sp. TaxID=1610747 RepID=UPI0035C9F87C
MSDVPAARHTLQVLDYLGRQAAPVTAAAVVRDLGLPRSTVYHLLATLADHGYVTHLPEDRRWGLGLAAYELGSGYSRQAPLQRAARAPLAELVDRSGASAHLAVLAGAEVVYVIEDRAPGLPALVTDVGVRLPAQSTASGRALLASLPAAHVRALFPSAAAFTVRTDAGPRSPSALRARLIEARRLGYATEDGEVTPGFGSVAAAVFDHAGHPVAAVAATTVSERAADERLVHHVRRTAAGLSRRLGGSGRPAGRDGPARSGAGG